MVPSTVVRSTPAGSRVRMSLLDPSEPVAFTAAVIVNPRVPPHAHVVFDHRPLHVGQAHLDGVEFHSPVSLGVTGVAEKVVSAALTPVQHAKRCVSDHAGKPVFGAFRVQHVQPVG